MYSRILYELTMLAYNIWFQLKQIAPYWALGLIAGSLVSVFLSEKITGKMAVLSTGRLWFFPVCIASFLGIVSPLCMYGTVPVMAALGKKQVPQHLLAAFMISSVLLNPNLFIMSFNLGIGLALARLVFSFLCGLLAGVLAFLLLKGKKLFTFEKFDSSSEYKKKKTFFKDLFKAFRITAPYLLFGVTLAAVFDRYIEPEWIASIFGQRRGLGVLFATTLSVPLYACGGGTIPLIRAWLEAGMGQGDALAFMLAGPATKITNLSAVKMIFSTKNFLLYLTYCLLFAILAGLFVEFCL